MMVKHRKLKFVIMWLSLNVVCAIKVKNVTSAVKRHIRSLTFPDGSGMGVFFAIGIPLDLPEKSVAMAFYFEANYQLPDKNSTYLNEFPSYLSGKSLTRKIAYEIIVNKLERAGYPGWDCLLRAICEAASSPVTGNGLIGDIIHIFFTPSSSQNENLPKEIAEAEKTKNCLNHYNCSMNILDLISHYDDEIN